MSLTIKRKGLASLVSGALSGGGGFATNLEPLFVSYLQTSLIPQRGGGSSTPTFTRATTAYQTDFEGKLNLVPSGAARMQGARYVRNLLTFTEDFSNAAWVLEVGGNGTVAKTNNYGVAPDGTTTAARVVATKGSGFGLLGNLGDGSTQSASHSEVMSLWLKSNTGATQTVWFSSRTNNATPGAITVTTSWQRFATPVQVLSTTAPGGIYVGAFTASDASLDFLIWHPQEEPVLGQANQNPSEYVSVGVLSAPYHGAGVDGVKYFNTLNGNTVTSNVVTEATGAAIVAGAAGVAASAPVDAGGPFGYLAEGVRTNLLLQSRDMTNVAWTAGATMTVARTSIGVDGVANSANRLTAGAVTATNIITQLVTAAALSRTYSAYIKRITGTGPVRLSEDNFTGGTDVSGSLVANQWVLVQFTASILNAVVGIKIDTNTDAIDVDMNQFEAGAFASSPIPTTTVAVARNAEVFTYPSAGNISGTVGTIYAEVVRGTQVSGRIVDFNNPFRAFFVDTGSGLNDGTSSITGNGSSVVNSLMKIAFNWGGDVAIGSINGAAPSGSGAFDGNLDITGPLYVGTTATPDQSLFGTIRNLRFYPVALSAAQLQAMTS